jgi:N6-adenosine-specific RNA methylase IME4
MYIFEPSCTRFSKLRKYGVIYADPPWSFRNWSAKGTGRNAISHYDCLDPAALAAMPVADLAADNCVLFLWAVDPLLPRALDLICAWGFEYKTVGFYWVKLNSAPNHAADYFTGLGYWTRANPEQCLMATRGKPPRKAKNAKNGGSIAASRIASASGSKRSWMVLTSNCSHVIRPKLLGSVPPICASMQLEDLIAEFGLQPLTKVLT